MKTAIVKAVRRCIARCFFKAGYFIFALSEGIFTGIAAYKEHKKELDAQYAKYFLLLLFFVVPHTADAVWFDSNWSHRVKVEVNPTRVGSSTAITNYPVFVDLASMPAGFWSNVQSDGDDIRVTEADEVTETAFELVTMNTASSTGELHFLADTLSTTSSSTFYIYYGNPSASPYAVTATYGRNNVWTEYVAVYHFQGTTTDSRGNNTLVNDNSTPFTASRINSAAEFNGSNNRLRIEDANQTGLDPVNGLTVSFWARPDALAADAQFVSKEDCCSSRSYEVYHPTGNRLEGVVFGSGGNGQRNGQSGASQVSTGSWQKFHATYNLSSNNWQLYKSGATITTTMSNTGVTAITNSTGPFGVGARYVNPNWQNYFDGGMDELRVRATTSPAAWIVTEWNNQNSTSTFYSIGAQETDTGTPAVRRQSEFFF